MSTAELSRVNGGFSYKGYKGKGGGEARPPAEASDTLRSTSYAKVLDLISEGEITGLVNGLQSVYLDGTPIQNESGSLNFQGVTFDIRHGTQHQDYIPGFPAVESTAAVGVELKASSPWTRYISRRELSAVRITLGVNGLSKADKETGDINGYSVQYAIDLQTDAGEWFTVVSTSFTGKTTSQYRRTHRIDLPYAATGWTIRVRRITPNANSATTADTTVIDSITEVIDAKLRYPMSALAGIILDASQFSSVPTRAYHVRGKLVKVPSNYNPETRAYSGVWNGTFKLAYSNNPAWVFYDLVTSEVYGLGSLIPASWVNKWALYQIGQYCDELVSDGKGGTEPRFTCNLYLQTKQDAYKVLQDLCSVFRGMVYWAAGTAVPVADMPRDPVYTYTQANVIDGQFTYSGTRRKDRATVAIVSYNDMSDFGRAKVVYWQDDEAVARYGVRKLEITAFGCTSESQALRLAKWSLLTSKMETRSVTFKVGLDGTLVAPGSVIRVADNLFAGKRIGGRVVSATANSVVLDADLVAYIGDKLTVTLPSGKTETREVFVEGANYFTVDTVKVSADTVKYSADTTKVEAVSTKVTVKPPFSEIPEPESVWALESERLVAQLFSVLSVSESDDNTFEISAVQHEPGKYSAIDYGTKIDTKPIVVLPPKVQPAPQEVFVSSINAVYQGLASTTVVSSWAAVDDAIYYELQWKRDDSDWVAVPRLQTTRFELQNAYRGIYTVRVRAINAIAAPSAWTISQSVFVDGRTPLPPKLVNFYHKPIVFGIELYWGFEEGIYTAEYTEVRYALVPDIAQSFRLANFSYPQNSCTLGNLKAGENRYFWARIVDKSGNAGPWSEPYLGTSSSSAEEVLDVLNGQITETQLGQQLKEAINSGGGASIAVEQLATELAAMYSIKVQYNQANGTYQLAGIGVGVENSQGVLQSQVLVSADRFAILPATTSSAAQAASPFIVQNGQVFIKQAFIQDASIGAAKIAEWLESDAKGPGNVPVLRLNFRTGELQMNAATAGQGRLTINNRGVRLWDANNVERITIGF